MSKFLKEFNMHILSLVLGIFGVILIFVPVVNFIFAPMLSSAAIITGTIGRILTRHKDNEDDRKIATGGLILGLVGMGLCLMLYGSCAFLVNKWYEPKKFELTGEEEEEIDQRMDDMERRIGEEMERLSELIEDSMEKMEKRLPEQPGADTEESEKMQQYLQELMEKKDEMKNDLKKWEEWIEKMPILEEKKKTQGFGTKEGGGEKLPEEKPKKAKDSGLTIIKDLDAKSAFSKPEKKPKTKKTKSSPEDEDLKTPKIFKEIPETKTETEEEKGKLISPYDYF